MFPTIDEMPPAQRVLCRIDINAPVEDGTVRSTMRFERHAETVQQLIDDDHAVALLAHQGRPGRDTYVPLEQHAAILSRHLGQDVRYVDDTHDDAAQQAVRALDHGAVLLLENTRFTDHELADRDPAEHAQNGFVRALKDDFDCFVNDAYSAAHRPHASLVGFPQVMDAYAGTVMAEAYRHNSRIQDGLDGDTTMVVGGKKPEDVLYVMQELIDVVDDFLVGGVIAELFLRAEGHDVGYDVDDSQFMNEQWLEHRETLKQLLAEHRGKIHLPLDLAYHDDDRERTEVAVTDAAKTEPYWDIGHETVDKFAGVLRNSDAVFVKGALGVFEDKKFCYGTRTILNRIGDQDCFAVVGGGDTARCVDMYDLDADRFDHVSIAGGAYIRALAGDELPAVKALRN
jgi:phosphoglycerate kinase